MYMYVLCIYILHVFPVIPNTISVFSYIIYAALLTFSSLARDFNQKFIWWKSHERNARRAHKINQIQEILHHPTFPSDSPTKKKASDGK